MPTSLCWIYHGLTLEEFLADDAPRKCIHPEDLQKFAGLRQSGMASGTSWEGEIRLLRKDGQYRWFLMRVKALRDDEGRPVRWYAAGTDIEDRKQAEAELRQLVDAVPQDIVTLDGDGRRLHANQVVLDYHGLTLEEFLVIDQSECFHPEEWDSDCSQVCLLEIPIPLTYLLISLNPNPRPKC